MSIFEIMLAVIGGLLLGMVLLGFATLGVLAVLPLFKAQLLDNPNDPNRIALFTAPEPGWSIIIMRESRIEHIIHGKEKDEKTIEIGETFQNGFLKAYDKYAFLFGLRLVGIPGIHQVRSYDLPRSRRVEVGGKLEYQAVTKEDPSRRSNHFRTQLTPWFNEFKGVDIEGIPFDVKCATNYRLDKGMIPEVAFGVESWNTLLDQALNSVARGTLREKISLDDAIGGISQDIWKENVGNATQTDDVVQNIILDRLLSYRLKVKGKSEGKTLAQMGIIIEGFEILDFAPEELTPEELVKLRSPALARRTAQARVMEGKAEAEFQDQVLAVLAKHPELAAINVNAEAFVKAAKAGTLDALAAGLLKKLTQK